MKQVSIFIENRAGRLAEVLGVLKKADINMQSLSLADTSDYGVLRLLVDKPEECKDALKAAGFSAKITDVLAVKLGHRPGALQELLEVICSSGINIEYMYALTTSATEASIVIKTKELEKVEELVKTTEVEFL